MALGRLWRESVTPGNRARPQDQIARLAGARVLRCLAAGPLVRWTAMEPTEAEKLTGQRARRLLFLLMALMMGAPFLILLLQNR
jgi:hypothetical protein